jgi:FtsH-binding integral membrane protein
MPSCDNYFGKIFAHLGGALAISALSAEYSDLDESLLKGQSVLVKFMIHIVVLFALLFLVMSTEPGSPFKYVAFIALAFALGQVAKPYWDSLGKKGDLARVLTTTTGVFVGMMAVGFYDSQNLLGFGPYLAAGLAGMILAEFIVMALGTEEEKKSAFSAFRLFGIGLFSVYTAYDVQVIKAKKSVCGIRVGKKKLVPDYPADSLKLYLDFLNLFTNMGDN